MYIHLNDDDNDDTATGDGGKHLFCLFSTRKRYGLFKLENEGDSNRGGERVWERVKVRNKKEYRITDKASEWNEPRVEMFSLEIVCIRIELFTPNNSTTTH